MHSYADWLFLFTKMKKKQTAIDLLLEIMEHRHGMLLSIDIKDAKAIEREQIKKAFIDGCLEENYSVGSSINAEQYYNNTYGSI